MYEGKIKNTFFVVQHVCYIQFLGVFWVTLHEKKCFFVDLQYGFTSDNIKRLTDVFCDFAPLFKILLRTS